MSNLLVVAVPYDCFAELHMPGCLLYTVVIVQISIDCLKDFSHAGAGVREGRVSYSGVCADLSKSHHYPRLRWVCDDGSGCFRIWPDQGERAGQMTCGHCLSKSA